MKITEGGNSTVVFAPGPMSNYQWIAAGPDPCPRCSELDNQIRSLANWEASIVPGFHKHCHCKLVPVNVADSGMVFSCQAPYLTMEDILFAISALFVPMEPARFHTHHLFDEEAEGATDLVPYNPSKKDILEAISPVYVPLNPNYSTGYHGQ